MEVSDQIFREYDVRGVFGEDLTEEVAYHIGRAYARYIGGGEVIVGGDIRLSTETLRKSMIDGLLHSGADVIDIGVVPTPTFYFALRHLNCPAGVQITASHNPPEYNGFKLCKDFDTIYGDQIQQINQIIKAKDYRRGSGTYRRLEILSAYKDMLKCKFGKFSKKLKVVVDCGNGCGGLVVPQVLEELGCAVIGLYTECDGNFPNHHPDPTVVEYLRDLQERVVLESADLGVGYDGDVDRLGVVDKDGDIIWGDMLMVLFFREILKKYPGAPCIIEIKCTQALYEDVLRHGGKPFFYKTGHSLIKAKLRQLGAPFSGEMSGHMYFADEYWGFDDALYATLRLLRILDREGRSLNELLSDLPKYYSTPELRIDCPEDKKDLVVNEIASVFKERYQCIDVDGVRVLFDDGWGLLRKSNTGPKLILRFEAKTKERLYQIKELFIQLLKRYEEVNIFQLQIAP